MRFYLDDGGAIEAEVINGVWPDAGPGKIQDVDSVKRWFFHMHPLTLLFSPLKLRGEKRRVINLHVCGFP
jgi:hypothetical protein